MFDSDNQERNPNPGRFFFSNAPRKSGPILSPAGYSAFTTTFIAGWIVCVAFILQFHLQFTAAQGVVSAISSSAVDLAALSLTVLGILHEFNKEDRWFKLGLFLIGFLFALDCLFGYYLVVSWKEVYQLPQEFSIVVFGVFLIGFLFQTDWQFLFNRFLVKLPIPKAFKKTFSTPRGVRLNRIRLSIPFLIPLALIWINNLTPIVAFLLIFLGGIIALLSLMFVTIVMHVLQRQNPAEPEVEDPVITYSRQIAIQQLKTSQRLQELKQAVLEALGEIQEERIKQTTDSDHIVSMISDDVVEFQLRRKGITFNHQEISNVLRAINRENLVFESKGDYWLVPSSDQIRIYVELTKKVYWFGTRLSKRPDKSQLEWKNYDSSVLTFELAKACHLPVVIIGEYVLPAAYTILKDEEVFERIEISEYSFSNEVNVVFVNLELKKKIEDQDLKRVMGFAHLIGFSEWVKNQGGEINNDLLDIVNAPSKEIQETLEQKKDREILLEKINQELSTGKTMIEIIPLLGKTLFSKYRKLYFARKPQLDTISILSSRNYRDGYYSAFSDSYNEKLWAILSEGVVINTSSLIHEFKEYEREKYQRFLQTLGLEIDPVNSYLNSEYL